MKYPALAVILGIHAASSAQALEFAPLVNDWMAGEEVVLAEAREMGVRDPKVASNGRGYLVVWDEWTEVEGGWSLVGVVVDAFGHVIPGSRFSIASTAVSQRPPKAVASNGDSYALLWKVTEASERLVAIRINAKGEILDPDPIEIASDGSSISDRGFDIQSNGGSYLIAWNDDDATTLQWRMIDFGGDLVTEIGNLDNIDRHEHGRGLTIVRSGGGFRLMPERELVVDLSPSGEILETHEDFIPNIDNVAWLTMASADPATYFLWRDNQTIKGANSSGVIPLALSPSVIVPEGFDLNGYPSIATDGLGYFVMWRDKRSLLESGSDQRVIAETFATRISSSGEVLDPLGIPLVAGPRSGPRAALSSNGSSYLAVFEDNNSTLSDGDDDTIKAKLIINPNKYLVLSEPARNTEGAIEFQFNAAPGHAFAIEHTEDFSQWTELTRFDDFPGEAIVSDQPGEAAARFYRAKKLNL